MQRICLGANLKVLFSGGGVGGRGGHVTFTADQPVSVCFKKVIIIMEIIFHFIFPS